MEKLSKFFGLIYVALFVTTFTACSHKEVKQESLPPSKEELTKTPLKSTNIQRCEDLIESLIKTSSYKNDMDEKDVYYIVDEIDNGIISIDVRHENDEHRSVHVGWVSIDLNKNILQNKSTVFDEDSVVLITNFNKSLLKALKKQCPASTGDGVFTPNPKP